MTVIDKKDCRKAAVIRNEISSLQNLIDRRHLWLEKPGNKLRRTYKAVLQDTTEMEEILKELRHELEEAKQLTNK